MKANSRYPTVLIGVSQQVPHARVPGQHAEQVNLIPDPVTGLARRWGSVFTARGAFAGDPVETANSRTLSYRFDGKDYVVCLPLSTATVPAVVYNATDKKVMEVVYSEDDNEVAALLSSGVSAATALGRYAILAANTSAVTLEDTSPMWDDVGVASPYAALWIRSGAYDRKFVVTVSRPGVADVVIEYRTPTAAYPGTLDVTGIPVNTLAAGGGTEASIESAFSSTYTGAPSGSGRHRLNYYQWEPSALTAQVNGVSLTNVYPAAPSGTNQFSWNTGDPYVLFDTITDEASPVVTISYTHLKVEANPNYTPLVTDLTARYNAAVTDWISASATAIMADNIAVAIKDLAVAAGLTATVDSGHVYFSGVSNVVADDGGDGTLVRVAAHTVQDVTELTSRHRVGHTIRVKPSTSGDVFYMVATAKIEDTDWQEVLWVEGQRQVRQLRGGLVLGSPDPETNIFYMASPEYMDTLRVPVFESGERVTPEVPQFQPSTVGDEDSDTSPYFTGKTVNYLGVFQDRLLVGSAGVLRASKTGDYFNFYRSSVLTTAADDTLELMAKGADDDIIRYSVEHERNLLLFGTKQYMLSGAAVLSPTNAVMPALGNHTGADTMQPVTQGGLVFYVKRGPVGSSLYQLQPGAYAESFEAYSLTPHLNSYIPKTAVEVTLVSEPALVLVRHANGRSLTLFQHLDASEKRQQAAWYTLVYPEGCGVLASAVQVNGELILVWLRGAEVVVDTQPLNTDLSVTPYLDSQVPKGEYAPWATHSADAITWIGDTIDLPVTGDAVYSGMVAPAFVELSPPFTLDSQGRSNLSADITVARVSVELFNSAGCVVKVASEEETIEYTVPPELVDIAAPDTTPVTNNTVIIPVCAVNTEYALTIAARLWLPLTLTAVHWTGQVFNRSPEV